MMLRIRLPRNVRLVLGIATVLLLLVTLTVATTLVVRRERALRRIPLQQPEVVPALKRQELESAVARVYNAPVAPLPSPAPSPTP